MFSGAWWVRTEHGLPHTTFSCNGWRLTRVAIVPLRKKQKHIPRGATAPPGIPRCELYKIHDEGQHLLPESLVCKLYKIPRGATPPPRRPCMHTRRAPESLVCKLYKIPRGATPPPRRPCMHTRRASTNPHIYAYTARGTHI
jgi:hypothetical protein